MPEWLSFLLADTSALQLVFWIVAIGALIAVLVKLWPALTQFVTIMNAVTGLPEFIARTNTSVDEIHHEVHYNDGTSAKDAIKRVEDGVAGLYDKVEGLASDLADAKTTLSASDAQIRADLERRRGLEDDRVSPR